MNKSPKIINMSVEFEYLYQIALRKRSSQPLDLLNCQLISNAKSIVIMGASGSGKTLFLKSLAGLLSIDEGYIHFQDQTFLDIQNKINMPIKSRKISYLFQEFALFPHLTVAQNIALASTRSIFSLRKNKAVKIAEKWLDLVDLSNFSLSYPQQLSGGQKQRVGLARALAAEPNLLLVFGKLYRQEMINWRLL